MSDMFKECKSLERANLEGLNFALIFNMKSMFDGCENLKYLNILNLNTRHLIIVNNIFRYVKKIVEVKYNPKQTSILLKSEIDKIAKNLE